jgi:hypothetical protein
VYPFSLKLTDIKPLTPINVSSDLKIEKTGGLQDHLSRWNAKETLVLIHVSKVQFENPESEKVGGL